MKKEQGKEEWLGGRGEGRNRTGILYWRRKERRLWGGSPLPPSPPPTPRPRWQRVVEEGGGGRGRGKPRMTEETRIWRRCEDPIFLTRPSLFYGTGSFPRRTQVLCVYIFFFCFFCSGFPHLRSDLYCLFIATFLTRVPGAQVTFLQAFLVLCFFCSPPDVSCTWRLKQKKSYKALIEKVDPPK